MQRFDCVCIASGPSLTKEDCQKVRKWRQAKENRKVFVVNTTYQIATWADYLYAHDKSWWEYHKSDVDRLFKGKLLSATQVEGVMKVHKLVANSGAGALITASLMGAKKIIMLGYDCKKTNGMAHWHGDHPNPLGNAGTIDGWHEQFQRANNYIKCEVINASRETALTLFNRMELEEALN